ncbi:nicotinate (nicotinamide) nucleotide adenylyltransferase [Catalinimonas niigatensis]|uniref:nicotinate (nicotinamide) nucleotide adenylyltransferase n=1 Tax=Catalinimonas niigatensis TaxID=1397264 RepID=UPI002666E49C|nr:nicotinate (nicotinamide) nucleotide adenylyltransferase [Catalinimonas niigatensis]WPP52535.1 nicotinate (nicotinamide) nucleotide adenylyltransferase [Catalinimonas niigatensis]
MKVGLFFGSFNPIHVGHLIIANTVRGYTKLDQVWFVVSPQNPFKSSKSLLSDVDRLRMVELAIEDNFDLRVSNVEFSMPKPSYTVDTLAYLKDRYPQHHFTLILGSDNLRHFHKWKNYQEILSQHGIIIYPRPDYEKDKIREEIKNHPAIRMVNAPLMDISATFIRDCIKKDISIKYLVHDRVEEYISAKKFYL